MDCFKGKTVTLGLTASVLSIVFNAEHLAYLATGYYVTELLGIQTNTLIVYKQAK